MEFLPQLPPVPELRATTCRVVGRYARNGWLTAHPDYAQPLLLQVVVQTLFDVAAARASSHTPPEQDVLAEVAGRALHELSEQFPRQVIELLRTGEATDLTGRSTSLSAVIEATGLLPADDAIEVTAALVIAAMTVPLESYVRDTHTHTPPPPFVLQHVRPTSVGFCLSTSVASQTLWYDHTAG